MEWEVYSNIKTLGVLKNYSGYKYTLPFKPLDVEQITIRVEYPTIQLGRIVEGTISFLKIDKSQYQFSYEGDNPVVQIDLEDLIKQIEGHQVKDDMEITVKIYYAKHPSNN